MVDFGHVCMSLESDALGSEAFPTVTAEPDSLNFMSLLLVFMALSQLLIRKLRTFDIGIMTIDFF